MHLSILLEWWLANLYFIHLISKYVLNDSNMPDTILDAGDTVVNKSKFLLSWSTHSRKGQNLQTKRTSVRLIKSSVNLIQNLYSKVSKRHYWRSARQHMNATSKWVHEGVFTHAWPTACLSSPILPPRSSSSQVLGGPPGNTAKAPGDCGFN